MNEYQTIRVIGRGTFGQAVLATSIKTKKMVVIKQISLNQMSEKEKQESLNEVKILKALSHPNIVQYIDSFTSGGKLCIVMEYAEGGDMYQRIKNARGIHFSEDQIMDWFIQLCLSLKYVHDKRILHRDLKTQNIFLGKSGSVKLGDFGIARVLQNTMECAKTLVGTPYYLSPEICQEKPYNSKSDVWSLGCVLYELATHKHAFEANSMKALVGKILRGIYPPISSKYSSNLRQTIDMMLQRDPRKRPSINTILKLPFLQERLKNFVSPHLSPQTPESDNSNNKGQVDDVQKGFDIGKEAQKRGILPSQNRFQKQQEQAQQQAHYQQQQQQQLLEAQKRRLERKRQEEIERRKQEEMERRKKEEIERQRMQIQYEREIKKKEEEKKRMMLKHQQLKEKQKQQSEQLQRQKLEQQRKLKQKQEMEKKQKELLKQRQQEYEDAFRQRQNHNYAEREYGEEDAPKIERKKKQQNVDLLAEERAKIFWEARQRALENKKRALQQLNGDNNEVVLVSSPSKPPKVHQAKPRDDLVIKENINGNNNMHVYKQQVMESVYNENDDDDDDDGFTTETTTSQPKFQLNGNTLRLPGVSEKDSLMYRVESLKMYLEKELGDYAFMNVYQILKYQKQDDDDDIIYHKIRKILSSDGKKGYNKEGYISLIHQLIFCEECFNDANL